MGTACQDCSGRVLLQPGAGDEEQGRGRALGAVRDAGKSRIKRVRVGELGSGPHLPSHHQTSLLSRSRCGRGTDLRPKGPSQPQLLLRVPWGRQKISLHNSSAATRAPALLVKHKMLQTQS